MKLALASLLILFAAPKPVTYQLTPREVSKEAFSKSFDTRWLLPGPLPRELDLETELRALLAAELDLELTPIERAAGGPGTLERLPRFGDLAAYIGGLKSRGQARALEDVLKRNQKVRERWGQAINELLVDDRLKIGRWDPDDDRGDDGLLMAKGWELPIKRAPWNDLDVDPIAEQGAVFVRGDLTSFKQAENDDSS